MNLPIYKSDKILGIDSAQSFPKLELPQPWLAGGGGLAEVDSLLLPQVSHGVRWSLAVDSAALWFVCEVDAPPFCDNSVQNGEFVEGLWVKDVAEFFLRDSETGEYQEFNISPMGAWWSCVFSSYRHRHMMQRRPSTVSVVGDSSDARWKVVFGVRLDELVCPLTPQTVLHVSVISHDGSGEPRYFSSHPIRGLEPDFHMPEVFLPVHIVAADAVTPRAIAAEEFSKLESGSLNMSQDKSEYKNG